MLDLEQKLRESLLGLRSMSTSDRILVAVSGGIDSMVLADAMRKYFPPERLIVAHFDHRTRGPASSEDGDLVEHWARRSNIACFRGERKGEGEVSEASLREERRSYLEEIRVRGNARWIATAHHADDQLETFWLRLLRGTTVSGLGSMRIEHGDWIKPLLHTTRSEIEDYAKRHGIEFREDTSNADPRFLRNRVRRELIPTIRSLAEQYGGERMFLEHFSQTLTELQWLDQRIEEQIEQKVEGRICFSPRWTRLDGLWFSSLSPQWKQRTLRYLLERAGVGRVERSTLNRLLRAIATEAKNSSISGDWEWASSCGYHYVRRSTRARLPDFEMTGVGFQNKTLGIFVQTNESSNDGLHARYFAPGDRFGSHKLKELLLERRIPAPERELVPVIVDRSDRIVWCPLAGSTRFSLKSTYPYLFSQSN